MNDLKFSLHVLEAIYNQAKRDGLRLPSAPGSMPRYASSVRMSVDTSTATGRLWLCAHALSL
ncbi:hypothetical protein C8J43_11014 [Sphingomonas sp. PP-CE-1G-424]|nr:hypothetical protein C8J43_11014 [Sphingomonas sp. PP-CE-1G-424]